jgi:arylsulfatase A-like enzyme
MREPDQSASARRTIVWCSFWLALSLVLCKSALLGLPSDWSRDTLLTHGRTLTIMSHADVFFALCMGLLGMIAAYAARHRQALRRAVPVAMVVSGFVSVLYGIVSVQIFAYLRTPLTYPLIYLAGDMKNMRSSLGAFVTPTMLLALAAGPALYLGLVAASNRWVRPRPTLRWSVLRTAGMVLTLACIVWGRMGFTTLPWCDRVDRRVAENAHWILMKSFATDLLSEGRLVQLGDDFPPDALHDFETLAERKTTDVIQAVLPAAPSGALNPAHVRPVSIAPPKNVIIYVLESVGARYLSLFGSDYDTTPCLNRESSQALVFDNFYAHCGVTANSLVAINLGIYPGLTWREYTVEQPRLPGVTLAQLLHARGYRTSYMTSGEIQYVNMDGFLAGRGYDLVCGYEWLGCPALIMSWGVEDRCLVDSMLRWIDQDTERPFCAMIWTQQTHHPYEPSPTVPFVNFFRGLTPSQLPPDDYDLGRYLNVVREADCQLGRLFDGLRRRGIADDTVVVVTGDHGEGFGAPHDIYGHGGRVFDEIVRVPLMIWNPRLFAPGRRVSTIGGHIDLNPTLAEMLGVSPAGTWQGRSLFDLERPPRAYFYAANDDYLLGMREDEFKYIYNANIAREQLFDLSSDPHEQSNLAADAPGRCRAMRQRLAAWMKYEQGHIAVLKQ